MALGTFTRDWIATKALISYRGATPPDPTKFRLCLADANTLNAASTKADFIASELLTVNGYSRQPFISENGTYNATSDRYELPPVDVSFTASGGQLQFQTAFLIANADEHASRSFTPLAVSPADGRIAIASHGLVNGDEVLFSAAPGATLPSGLIAGLLYKIASNQPDNFGLTDIDGGVVAIADTGSGTFYCRYATGTIVCFLTENAQVQVLDAQTHTYRIPISESS